MEYNILAANLEFQRHAALHDGNKSDEWLPAKYLIEKLSASAQLVVRRIGWVMDNLVAAQISPRFVTSRGANKDLHQGPAKVELGYGIPKAKP